MLEIAPLLLYMRIRLSTVVTRYPLLSVALSVNRCHVSETPQLAYEPTDRLPAAEGRTRANIEGKPVRPRCHLSAHLCFYAPVFELKKQTSV